MIMHYCDTLIDSNSAACITVTYNPVEQWFFVFFGSFIPATTAGTSAHGVTASVSISVINVIVLYVGPG